MASEFRGEVRPRRQSVQHHIVTNAATHVARPVDDPFAPISNTQFPAMYTRSPVKNAYRRYMRMKSPYSRQRL